ncbi:MAG: hypothetical protein AAFR73_01540 [Pseudomonadota bacterium]
MAPRLSQKVRRLFDPQHWGLRLAVLIIAVATVIFALGQVHGNRITDRSARLILHLNAFEDELGFGGMIHAFKKAVLRGDEPEHAAKALDAGRAALAGLDLPEAEVAKQGVAVELVHSRQVVLAYLNQMAVVTRMHVAGASPRDIDRAVRVDDGGALRELTDLRTVVEAQVQRSLALLRFVDGLMFVVSLIAGACALIMMLKEDRAARTALVNASAALDRELSANEELIAFSYAPSHDLKGPLNTV